MTAKKIDKQENIRFELVTVTPELAKRWLDNRDPLNRLTSPPAVRSLANEMIGGRWRLTHQPIAFNSEGRLFDGQHRLSAVVLAETAVKMYAAFYENPNHDEAKLATDTGRSRSIGNVLDIVGTTRKGRGSIVSAIVSAMAFATPGSYQRFTPATVTERYAANKDAIEWAIDSMPRPEFNAVVMAAVAFALPTDKAKVEEFVSLIVSKAGIVEGSAANKFVKDQARGMFTTPGGSNARQELFKKALRLIYAHVKGESIDKVYGGQKAADYFVDRRRKLGIDPVA